jgi:hypothetical protein
VSEAFRLHFLPTMALRTGLRPAFRPLRAYLCHQSPAREIDVGQRQRDKGAIGVLCQTAIAHLREAPKALDDGKHVLNPSTDLRLVAILAARYLVNFARTARTLIGEVACLGGLVERETAMQISVQIVVQTEVDKQANIMGIARFERDEFDAGSLGLQLEEAKALLGRLQRSMIEAQAAESVARMSVCPECGAPSDRQGPPSPGLPLGLWAAFD